MPRETQATLRDPVKVGSSRQPRGNSREALDQVPTVPRVWGHQVHPQGPTPSALGPASPPPPTMPVRSMTAWRAGQQWEQRGIPFVQGEATIRCSLPVERGVCSIFNVSILLIFVQCVVIHRLPGPTWMLGGKYGQQFILEKRDQKAQTGYVHWPRCHSR